MIRAEVVDQIPPDTEQLYETAGVPLWRPTATFASGRAPAMKLLFCIQPPKEPLSTAHRFVIYQPGVEQVEIAGSFTDPRTLPL